MTETTTSAKATRSRRRRRRKGGRWNFWRRIPAVLVFYVSAAFSVAAGGLLFVRGEPYLMASVAACIFTVLVLVLNDGKGFYRSREMRRAHEARRNFSTGEVFVLLALLLANLWLMVPVVMDKLQQLGIL